MENKKKLLKELEKFDSGLSGKVITAKSDIKILLKALELHKQGLKAEDIRLDSRTTDCGRRFMRG